MRYVLVNESNIVVNVIEYTPPADPEDPTAYSPPVGQELVQSDTAEVGDVYDPIEENFTTPDEDFSDLTIDEAKARRYGDLQRARLTFESSGATLTIDATDSIFPINQNFKIKLLEAKAQLIDEVVTPTGGSIRDIDNVAVTVNDAELSTFINDYLAYVQAIESKFWEIYDEIDALGTVEGIMAYTINFTLD